MSIIDTLITDRTQADVDAGNAKGTYKASDLNRVSAAMEYLHDLFESYGYFMPNYKRIKLQRPGHYETHTVMKPVLPDEYTQLEYIESTGTQYIDTEIPLKTNMGVKATIRSLNSGNLVDMFGTQDTSNPSSYFTFAYLSGQLYVEWSGTGTLLNSSPTIPCDYDIEFNYLNSGNVILNGSNHGSVAINRSTSYNLYICADNLNGGATRFSNTQVKKYIITVGIDIARDYVPAKRLSDNAIGLFDKADQKFYPNAGTGVFTAGPENIEYETITEEVFVPDERDPYTWFEDDIPTSSIMAQYITNLSELRGQFAQAATTPAVPPDMDGLTWKEANNIEKILEDVDALLTNISAAWFYSGDLYSGEV